MSSPAMSGGYLRAASARFQDERPPRLLVEVEVPGEVPEDADPLAHGRARIRPPVRLLVESLLTQEVVLDELRVGVEAQCLVVDVALSGVRADHEPGHAQAVAVPVHHRRNDVVVKTAPVVPG